MNRGTDTLGKTYTEQQVKDLYKDVMRHRQCITSSKKVTYDSGLVDTKYFYEDVIGFDDVAECFENFFNPPNDNSVRVIIAGGRGFTDEAIGFKRLDYLLGNLDDEKDIEVVCGEAKGADTVGKKWAESRGHFVKSFIPDWEGQGKAAGHIRNREMAKYAAEKDSEGNDRGYLIAFWDGKSKGTKGMIETAEKLGLKIRVVRY